MHATDNEGDMWLPVGFEAATVGGGYTNDNVSASLLSAKGGAPLEVSREVSVSFSKACTREWRDCPYILDMPCKAVFDCVNRGIEKGTLTPWARYSRRGRKRAPAATSGTNGVQEMQEIHETHEEAETNDRGETEEMGGTEKMGETDDLSDVSMKRTNRKNKKARVIDSDASEVSLGQDTSDEKTEKSSSSYASDSFVTKGGDNEIADQAELLATLKLNTFNVFSRGDKIHRFLTAEENSNPFVIETYIWDLCCSLKPSRMSYLDFTCYAKEGRNYSSMGIPSATRRCHACNLKRCVRRRLKGTVDSVSLPALDVGVECAARIEWAQDAFEWFRSCLPLIKTMSTESVRHKMDEWIGLLNRHETLLEKYQGYQ